MTRLLVHVEGQTEEAFVNVVLAPYLYNIGYTQVRARLLGNARNRLNRGGIKSWPVVRKDIQRHLANDVEAYGTTMVDYYALPHNWPGRNLPNGTIDQRHETMRTALSADFQTITGIEGRFIPFVLMHEFEALLFSDCEAFGSVTGDPSYSTALQNIRDQFENPEHINDSPHTAPSKRILNLIPDYDKVLFGNVAASEIGLEKMRAECPCFGRWVKELEQIIA